MARIVIVGSGGRLGGALTKSYEARHDVIGLNRQSLDLSSPADIRQTLGALKFDVAINCAALTNVDFCETHREEAFLINTEGARLMAEICHEKGAQFMHVSTDYVLDGEKDGAYTEDDEVVPASVYGESKRAGELAVLDVSADFLAIRVSWVFGPHRPSFIDTMLNRALVNDQISAVGDKTSTPSYTFDLASMMEPYFTNVRAGGVLHLCNGGSCTWRDYAQFALDVGHEAGLPLKANYVEPIPLESLKAFVPKRPRNTVMSTARHTALTGETPRPWQDAVREYVMHYGKKIIDPTGTA